MDNDKKVRLSEILAQLHKELIQAQSKGEHSPLKLETENVEFELQMAKTKKIGGGVGVKFWIFDGDAPQATAQKPKLKLQLVESDENSPASEDEGVKSD